MNPYGTTRQSVGGQNHYEPTVGRKWYDVIPFRPCRPPTPDWIVDWPLEQLSRVAPYLLMFAACRDAALLQDPRQGLAPGLVLPQQPQQPETPSAGDTNLPILSMTQRWITWGLGTNAGTRSTVPLGLFTAPFVIMQFTYYADAAASFPMQFNFEIGKATADVRESTVAVASGKPYVPLLPELIQQSSFSSLPPGTNRGQPLFATQNAAGYSSFFPKFVVYESTHVMLALSNFGGIALNAAGSILIIDNCSLDDLKRLTSG